MHLKILILINMVAHVAYSSVDDECKSYLQADNPKIKQMEFGTKNTGENDVNYREFVYILDGQYPHCEGDSTYMALIPKMNDLEVSGVTSNLTKHYLCHKYNFKDIDIPGHLSTAHTPYDDKIGGYYWYNPKESSVREIPARLEYLCSTNYEDYSRKEGDSIQSQMHSISPDAIKTPQIIQNYFLHAAGEEKFSVKLKLKDQLYSTNRLFVRVLGPSIKDSYFELRGVVWKYSCTNKDEVCKKNDISIDPGQIDGQILKQLNFVRNIKNINNEDENKKTYPRLTQALFGYGRPTYAVAAFQCNSGQICSPVHQVPLNEFSTNEGLEDYLSDQYSCNTDLLKGITEIEEFKFGSKVESDEDLTYDELRYKLKKGLTKCKDGVEKLVQIPIIKHLDENNANFELNKHYICPISGGVIDYKIPGHRKFGDGGIGGQYRIDLTKIKHQSALRIAVESKCKTVDKLEVSVGKKDWSPFIGSWPKYPDSELKVPNIEKAYYSKEDHEVFIRVNLKDKKEEGGRLFTSVLGPVVKGSKINMRGVVLKFNCTYSDKKNICTGDEYKRKFAQFSEEQAKQILFLRDNKHNKELMEELFGDNALEYVAIAYTCKGDVCGNASQIEFKVFDVKYAVKEYLRQPVVEQMQ